MIKGIAATASDPVAAEAARAALASGASAADALVAGFLAAAGAHPGVLLGPAVALAGGAGAGARAFDGRVAQPGRDSARPRGILAGAAIPASARVGAPRSVAMLCLLHTYFGRLKLRELARGGVAAAEERGAPARARILQRIGDAGVLALRAPEIVQALLAVAGPIAGGALTSEDLLDARPGEADAQVAALGGAGAVISSPWPEPAVARLAEVIVAVDARGGAAALAYAPVTDGVAVAELELEIGGGAEPVMRGVTRVSPGSPLPSHSPIALVTRAGGIAVALGLRGEAPLDPGHLTEVATGALLNPALEALAAHGRVLAAFGDGKSARVLD